MITKEEKLRNALLELPKEAVDRILLDISGDFVNAVETRRGLLLIDGFEDANDLYDKYLSKDGREVIWQDEKPYVLRLDVHNQRREEALALAREETERTETKSVVGTESLAGITCPRCHDALQYSKVCPACAAGQAGYHHRYVCVCGVDFVTKERL